MCYFFGLLPCQVSLPLGRAFFAITGWSLLKNIAQDMSEYHAEYNENRRADEIKAEKDKKHSFRHDFFVAAFTVALTLFFEHIHDIIEFVLKFFRSFS